MASHLNDHDLAAADLGPLAWVMDELRKSLEAASVALRRFVRDLQAGGDDPDTGALRLARQQLHQAVGALEMVGLAGPAQVLRAMESAVQAFADKPALCTEAAAARVDGAGFAIAEFLDGVLLGKRHSAVSLFPQYRDVQAVWGADRVHPADLWPLDWSWQEPVPLAGAVPAVALAYVPPVRSRMDQAVLRIVKAGDAAAARDLAEVCAGLAAGQAGHGAVREARSFWWLAAGFFEAIGHGLLTPDVYVKRAASRVLLQYAQLAKGEVLVSERLAQDLAFFCAQAVPPAPEGAPRLAAVRQAWGLARHAPVDYEQAPFGRFDPAVLAQVRKRVSTVREGWSALSGGDTSKVRSTGEQFGHLCDAMARLHAPLAPLAQALAAVADATIALAQPPRPELAMETATVILFLEAMVQDFDPADPLLAERAALLAGRLDRACQGQPAEPLEAWMEELYRHVSDRQTLGSVVGELRVALGELEKELDTFFRAPQDRTPLGAVPGRLSQMRGVLSVLGLDQAAQAVLRMRETVQALLQAPEGEAPQGVESLGNSLGALGFLVDMLAYQPALARKLFVLDDETGELRPVMGRVSAPPVPPAVAPPHPQDPAVADTPPEGPYASDKPLPLPLDLPSLDLPGVDLPGVDLPAPDRTQPEPALPPPPDAVDAVDAVDTVADLDDEADLLDIFLEEAREVALAGRQALDALALEASDFTAQTTLRRAFHTLKGSSRMVGLAPFGEAAWAMEQVLNAWLADQQPASADLLTVAGRGLEGLTRWVDDIAAGQDPGWDPQAFRGPAEAFRLAQQVLPFVFPRDEPPAADGGFGDAVEVIESAGFDEVIDLVEASEAVEAAPEAEAAADLPPPEVPEEQLKFIDTLRIPIPLFNIYLAEADEWSRRLQVELSEWVLDPRQPVPESLVALAHSLAGSSSTVGFQAMSGLARLLEDSLQRTQSLAWGTEHHARAWTAAAEDIRRMLHQFAAGFLKEPLPGVLEALLALDDLDIPMRLQSSGFGPDTLVAGPDAGTAASVDRDLFPFFEEEAQELLPQLGGALRQWHARPDNLSAHDEVLRALHTLKGSARLAGAGALGEMAHDMESQVDALAGEVEAAQVEPLLHQFDAIQAAFDALRQQHGTLAVSPPPPAMPSPAAAATASEPHATAGEPSPGAGAAASGEMDRAAPAAPARTALAPPVTTTLAPRRTAVGPAVRVRSHLLDRLMNHTGEVMITRSRMESELKQLRGSLQDLTGNLDRLREQLRDIELQAEMQMQSRLAQAKDSDAGFDPLEFDRFTRVQELTRMMAESVNDVATVQRQLQRTVQATEDDLVAQARQTRELQRDLLRTRMVEFESISDRLYRVVRQAAKETGKQVRLDIHGGRIEMDRGVLERMTPAFEHLLRNAVAHGIEPASARAAGGKPATGHIHITLAHEGNDVSVTFQDDGGGLDLARIRDKAFALGLMRPGETLDEEGAANLIFLPGFTTAGEVTELAGRGIGMDVVRAEVHALGGRIETASRTGEGTRFLLVLPLTTAVTQVVMVRCGAMTFGVPAPLVEIVHRASARDVQQAYNIGEFAHEGGPVPFHWGGALLRSSRCSREPQARTLPVLVMRSASQRVALHVDEVLGHQEVVVKHLGPQLARLPGLAGMTVLASGAVVLIYNPVALATVYGAQARIFGADQAQPHVLESGAAGAGHGEPSATAQPQIPLVLVVDDSITVRRVTQRLLQREGYRVATAADGLQALERLAQERPAVVLSDIEMPRMDGFDLLRSIRAESRWADLPVIMITSRIARKHRDLAAELGANHYLGKPYVEEELLSLVRRYAAAFLTTE